jgi:RNA polymerase sigma-70 factor, ECF subfamily
MAAHPSAQGPGLPVPAGRAATGGQPETGPPDADTAGWPRRLCSHGAERDAALAELHAVLLRVARAELRRRSGQ